MYKPTFDYDFANIVNKNLFYIDKTEYLWSLIDSGYSCFFMSRPRRFGKSLTVSTLKCIFEGRKELFKGLAIYDKPYDWKKYPVIHIDNGNCKVKSAEELDDYLHALIENIAMANGLELRGKTLSTDFQFLIEDMSKKAPVVILVDEYDKPILNNITNPAKQEILDVLQGFYSTIKTCASKIRFVFITGVSKFSHVSIFSDLNNLEDISMDPDYATMLGFTQEELEENFGELI
ncbi:MAG: AAA family ATPase, partial [Victivallaceae bacterium]|nr:AAA family ATPase [Victivallaceae bacterium]